MFKYRSTCFLCFLISFAVTCSTARSNEKQQQGRSEEAFLLVGAGMIVQDEPLKGIDTDVFPIPFFLYQGKSFSMRGISATYDVFGQESWTIGALARFRTDGYDVDDSSDLDGMDDRDNSLDLGIELSVEDSWGNIGISFLTDALGKHDGQEVGLTYTIPIRGAFGIKKLGLRPMLGASWRSDNLNNYYYGVRADEATAVRPRYNSGDSVDPFVGVGLDYLLDERWSIFSLLKNEWLGSEITESPIVDQHSTISIILGLVYRF